jgi:hypothetical protein
MPDDRSHPPDEPEDLDDLGDSSSRKFVADAVRKAFLTGVGALFLTEEGARKLAREWKLPKEVLGFVSSQASGMKDEVMRVVSDEVRKFFQSETMRQEFLNVLTSMSIEVNAEIRMKDVRGKVKPVVQRVSVKPGGKREEGGRRRDEDEPEDLTD